MSLPENIGFVSDRLDAMARTPRMWALTNEGFLLQVLTLLEVLGIDARGKRREDVEFLQETLSETYAAGVVHSARDLMAGLKLPLPCVHGKRGPCHGCVVDDCCL